MKTNTYLLKLLFFIGITSIISNNSNAQLCLTPNNFTSPGLLAQDVFAADLNKDGNIDAVTANGTANTITVYIGDGKSPFNQPNTYDLSGTNSVAVTVADFNKDAYLDIAVANRGSGNVSIFSNNKDGGFTLIRSIVVDGLLTDIVSGDFDNDGFFDLAVTSKAKNSAIYSLINDGKGGFIVNSSKVPAYLSNSLATQDFNKDGKLDLAVTHDAGVEVFIGAGDGTFDNSLTLLAKNTHQGIATADFNEDGINDLVFTSTTLNSIMIAEGIGDGTFDKPTVFATGTNPWKVAVEDLNGDKKNDIAVTTSTGLNVLLGLGKGSFGAVQTFNNFTTPRGIAIGDFYKDGNMDIIVTSPSTKADVIVLKNNGTAPIILISASKTTLCIGESVILTALKATNPVWNNGITDNVAFAPTATKTYTVTDYNTTTGCFGTSSISIKVNPLPIPNAQGGLYCIGGSGLTLSASGGITYNWAPKTALSSTIIANPVATPTSTTTYTVTVTDANNCSNSEAVTVTVGNKPTITATGSGFCDGTAGVTITASGLGTAGTYSWDNAATLSNSSIANPVATPTITTTYTVTGTNSVGCSNTATSLVKVFPKPTITNKNGSFCVGGSGDTIKAISSTTGTYSWTPTTNLTASNIFNPVANPSKTTSYTVKFTDANGCFTTGVSTVTVNPLPIISTTGGAFCSGNAGVTISATGAGTNGFYSWTPAITLSDPKSATPIATPTASTTYTVKAQDGNNCVNTATAVVTVNAKPIITTGGGAFCVGGNGDTLNVTTTSNGGTYAWTPTTNLSATNIANPIAKPSSSTTYTVTFTDLNGCTATGTAIIKVLALPTISTTGGAFCAGKTGVALSATGALTYVWSPSTGLSSTTVSNPTATPSISTNYTVVGTDKNNCSASAVATATVYDLPTATISGSASICAGGSSTINVALTGKAPWGIIYTDGTTTTKIDNITVSPYTFNVTPSKTTTYYLATVNDLNCTGTFSGSAAVTVNSIPTATITGTASICEGNSTNLITSFTGTSPWNFTYSDGVNSSTISGIKSSTYTLTVAPSKTTTYSISNVNSNSCVGTSSGSPLVTVNNKTTATISGNNSVCIGGNSSFVVNFSGTAQPWAISYSDGKTTSSINNIQTNPYTVPVSSPTSSTTYSLTSVTDNNACVVTPSGTASIVVNTKPTAVLSSTNTVCQGSTVNMSLSLTGTKPWNVTYTNGTAPVTISGITSSPYSFNVIPSTAGTYSLSSVSDANCTGTVSGTVTVNSAPEATLSGTKTICSGNSTSIDLNISSGDAPWKITYTDGVSTFTNSNVFSSAYSINVNPTSTTTYTLIDVSSTSGKGCFGTVSGSSKVIVNPAATAKISGTSSICIGKSTNLTFDFTGTAPWSVNYYDGVKATVISGITSSSYSVSVSPTLTTTYAISTFNDANTCSSTTTGTAIVTVLSLTDALCTCTNSATISSGGSICEKDSLNLSIALTGTSPWNLGYDEGAVSKTITGITSSPYILKVKPVSTTTYKLTSIGGTCNGVASGTAQVVVNTIPTATISGSKTICAGDNSTITVNLTGSSPYSFNYSDGTTTTSVSGITSSTYTFNVSPSKTTNYSLSNLKGNGNCSGTVSGTATITVKNKPTATISSNSTTICAGKSAQISTGFTGVQPWSLVINDGSKDSIISGITSTTNTLNLSPLSTKTYNLVSVTDANCSNIASGTNTITVNNIPKVVANASSKVVCEGEQITLFGSGANTYSWNNSVINNSSFSPSTKTYTVTGTDLNNCIGIDSVKITVNPLSKISINPINPTICIGDKTTLTATSTETGLVFSWNNNIANGVAFSPNLTQKYTVTATNTFGCKTKDSTTVTVKAAPTVKAKASLLTACYGQQVNLTAAGDATTYTWSNAIVDNVPFTATQTQKYVLTGSTGSCQSKDSITITVNALPTVKANASATTVCSVEKITLTATGNAQSYTWTDGILNGIPFTPSTKKYIVTADNGICQAKDSVNITVNLSPNVSLIANNNTICEGESVTLTASGASSFVWDNSLPSQTIQTIQPKTNTTYQVIGTSNNCADTASISISVNAKPTVSISASKTSVCLDDTAQLKAISTNNLTYLWDNGLGKTLNPIVKPTDTTTYNLIGTDLNGCSDSASVTIFTKPIPALTISNPNSNICGGAKTNISIVSDIPTEFRWNVTSTNVTGALSRKNGNTTDKSLMIAQTLNNTSKNAIVTYDIFAVTNGCFSANQQVSIIVDTCLVSANFAVDKSIVCSLDSISFTDKSIGANTWAWDFGNNASPSKATGKGPHKVKYTSNGLKTTKLVVTGLGGIDSINIDAVNVKVLSKPIITSNNVSLTQDSTNITLNASIDKDATAYHWNVIPTIAATIKDTTASANLVLGANYSGNIKLLVKSSNTFGCSSVSSDTLKLTRSGNFTIKAKNTTAFNNDSTTITATFVGSNPYNLTYTIGSETKTITGIKSSTYDFRIGQIGTITNLKANDVDNIAMTYTGNPVTISIDTIRKISTSVVIPICKGEKGKVYFNVSGGKTPYSFEVNNVTYKINKIDSVELYPNTYSIFLKDSTGLTSNISTNFTIGNSQIDLSIYNPNLNSDTTYVLNPEKPINPKVKASDFISTIGSMQYNWFVNDSISKIDSLGKGSGLLEKIVYPKYRYSGTIIIRAQGHIGACFTSLDTFNIVIKPYLKNNSTDTTIKYDLYGSRPFRMQLKINEVAKDTIIDDYTFEISTKGLRSLEVTQITDVNGNLSPIPEKYVGETDYSFYDGISPNGDEHNEYFIIEKYNTKNGTLKIYDELGFNVYESKNYDNNWAGTDKNNKALKAGVYMYSFECNGKKYSGTVEIRR